MTTILAVRHGGRTAVGGDGQVTLGSTVMKHGAAKVRRAAEGRVIVGFAGSAADSIALLERFEGFLKQHPGNVTRAAVELAKEWRTDRALRRLEAMMVVADREAMLVVSGTGDVIEPDDGVVGIGSGGASAAAAARALVRHANLGAEEIVREALSIAAKADIYTNDQIRVEAL